MLSVARACPAAQVRAVTFGSNRVQCVPGEFGFPAQPISLALSLAAAILAQDDKEQLSVGGCQLEVSIPPFNKDAKGWGTHIIVVRAEQQVLRLRRQGRLRSG